MAINNREDLITYVLTTANRTGDQDLVDSMGGFISIVESVFSTTLRTPSNETNLTYTTNSDGQLLIPEDYLEAKFLKVQTDQGNVILNRVSEEQGTAIEVNNGNIKYPTGFYRLGNVFQVVPSVGSCTVSLQYYTVVNGLTDSTDTNFVLRMYPQVYVYGLMQEISSFLKDEDRANYWGKRFTTAVARLQSIEDKAALSGSTLQVSPVY